MFTSQSQFYKPADTEQKPDEAVSITGWYLDTPKTYPEGSREKKEVFCPSDNTDKFLIKGHRYLFKEPMVKEKSGHTFYWQFWNEVIAYKLGRVINVQVPPAFVAYRKLQNGKIEYGALIEWFYGYPNSTKNIRVLQGGSLMSNVIEGFDRVKGRQHNFQSIKKTLDVFNFDPEIQSHLISEFFRMLVLDAITGNTDRHQENWEILVDMRIENDDRILEIGFSPAFDNGTSLGYEIFEENISNIINNLNAYTKKGKQHLKWDINSSKINHFEFIKLLLAEKPALKPILQEIINADITPVFKEIDNLTRFIIKNEKYRLSESRANLVKDIIKTRFNELKELNATN